MSTELVTTSTGTALERRDALTELGLAWLVSLSSENTRNAYRRDMADWAEWCHEHGLEVLGVERAAVDLYRLDMVERGLKPSTVARRLSALSSFYRYAVDVGARAASPLDRIRRPRVSNESPRLGLDRDELRAFLAAAEAAGPRDYALACLLSLNGLRVSEALGLTVADMDNERGHHVVRVAGKGGRVRTAPLAPRTWAAISDALGGREAGPLLTDANGDALNRAQAGRIVSRLARRAGITKRISPHSLRHTMVTLSLDAGVSLHTVQDAAGHASPETTRRYDRARHQLDGHATYALAQYLAA